MQYLDSERRSIGGHFLRVVSAIDANLPEKVKSAPPLVGWVQKTTPGAWLVPEDRAAAALRERPAIPFDLGETDVTLTASDAYGAGETCTTTVTVADTTPPIISGVTPSRSQLWPPNGAVVPITVSVAVTDTCSASPTSEVISVTSNEPETGGSDSTSPDWQITGPLSVSLRAERLDSGLGRVYTITVRCMDDAGNASQRVCTVFVPKNQKRKSQGEL